VYNFLKLFADILLFERGHYRSRCLPLTDYGAAVVRSGGFRYRSHEPHDRKVNDYLSESPEF
jgi:hypothetical protein